MTNNIACFLAFLFALGSPPASAEVLRATVQAEGLSRTVTIIREGEELFVPLFACGTLLASDARWYAETNRWEIRGKTLAANGFLDEPLVLIAGQPFLLKSPPRLINRIPHLSLDALRIMGRHGWELDVSWNPATKEIFVRPAQAAPAVLTAHARTLAVPAVPPGGRIVALDPGHSRQEGVTGLRGVNERNLGMRICAAVSATLTSVGASPVILRSEDDDLDPEEVTSLVNAVQADVFVSFHGSAGGDSGLAIWFWSAQNLCGTGIHFTPFEPPGGWSHTAQAVTPRSLSFARRLVRNLAAEKIPVRGPYSAPLACLEGATCPSIVVDFEGLSRTDGAIIATDEAILEKIARIVSQAALGEMASRQPQQ